MTDAIARPRIATLNETAGEGQAPCDIGGAWIVYAPKGHVTCVTSNRQAAEDAVYGMAAEEGIDPSDFRIEVWHIYERWDDDDAERERVTITLDRDLTDLLNRQLIERMLWMEANPDEGTNAQLQDLRRVWETVTRALHHLGLTTDEIVSRVEAGALSRQRAAEELSISEWEFAEKYGL